LYYPNEKWDSFIKAMLQQKYPIKSTRSYYSNKASRHEQPSALEGFSIHPVDASLLSGNWQNLEFLTEEMCSERVSIQEFLAKSFGVCLTKDDLIVGWCLSEYNTGHRCEIGIATHEEYRQRGFATFLTRAFVELARTRDVARIGWHCSTSNLGSGATALKAGFQKVEDYPVFIGWFDDTSNIARNGYFAHGRGEYAEALAFYEKSFSLGEVPDWVYWGAACDAALIGESEKAFKFLIEAIDHGFNDLEQIQSSKYLVSLHGTAGWETILKRLE
jgi:RimJ/RimL family protein N-acetyltransferase